MATDKSQKDALIEFLAHALEQVGYSEMTKTLAPFGFSEIRPGVYSHKYVNREFDLTDTPIEGVMLRIYNIGVSVGIEIARQEMREALGL